jgi:hypothetical protein
MKKLIGIGLLVALSVALGTPEATAQRGRQKTQSAPLTAAEKDWITLIRIDEKLARDVYLELYDIWGVRVFKNIAASETRHMAAVKTLIDKYRLDDPVAGLDVGEFPGEFQTLDDTLVWLGSQSVVDAYEVGVMIEELDIDDLTNALFEVQKADIKNVFNNLLDGSESHLEAFTSHL